MLATFIDACFSVVAGIIGTLIGFRVLGPKPGTNEKYDGVHRRWLRHLKWIGPLGIAFTVVKIAIAIAQHQPSIGAGNYKAELRKQVETAISEQGLVAQRDFTFEAAEGFSILIPGGYTYSRPANTPFALVAISKADSIATPAITVMVVPSRDPQEDFLKVFKSSLMKQNSSTGFSESTRLRNGNTDVTRITVLSLRENNVLSKANLLVASGSGKHYVAMIGTTDDLYQRYSAELERVVGSFRVR